MITLAAKSDYANRRPTNEEIPMRVDSAKELANTASQDGKGIKKNSLFGTASSTALEMRHQQKCDLNRPGFTRHF